MPERLLPATDREDRGTAFDRLPQCRAIFSREIGADDVLPLVLASPEEPHVGPIRVGPLADRVRPNLHIDAAPFRALSECDDVAAIAVDVHEVGIEVGDAKVHELNLPRTARRLRPARARPAVPASPC